jgi:hypothetical protein
MKEKELLVSTSLLPVLADYLEECNLKGAIKREANGVINFIRNLDRLLLEGAEIGELEQQIDIQRAFRQWVNEHFKTEDND